MPAQITATSKRDAAILAIGLAAVSAFATLPSIRGIDGVGNYVYAMSLLIDEDLDFTNEYAAIDARRDTPYRLSDAPVHPATGRPANRYGPGAALFWSPLIAVVHGGLLWRAPEMADGLSRPYEWAVALGSAVWGSLGLLMLFMYLHDRFGRPAAWLTITGIAFATPLGFYIWAHGSMSHAVSFFVAVVAMVALARLWDGPSKLSGMLAGFWAALLLLTRFQDVTWVLALGVGALLAAKGSGEGDEVLAANGAKELDEEKPAPKDDEGGAAEETLASEPTRKSLARFVSWRSGAFFALGAAPVILIQLAIWNALYGDWLSGPLPYLGGEGGRWDPLPRYLWGVLGSERGGAIAWHPILGLAVAGFFVTRGRWARPEAVVLALGLGLQLYLLAGWSMWWGGASFGNRFFISSYPWLALGLAALIAQLCRRMPGAILAIGVFALVAWNGGLLIQYGAEMIPREEEVGWGLVLGNQFTEVPLWILDRVSGLLG